MRLPVLKPGKTWANWDSRSPEAEGEQRRGQEADWGGNVEVSERSLFQARTNGKGDMFNGDRNDQERSHLLL